MQRFHRITILLFIVCFQFGLKAQTSDFDSLVIYAVNQIYNIKFNEAEKTFKSLISKYPKHPAGRFGLAMIDWWKIILDDNSEKYDDLFLQKIEDIIDFCDELLDKNPDNIDALFFKGGAIGFRGRFWILRENWLDAAADGREALPLVEHAARLDPSNEDVKLGFGIYNYYAEVIPDLYPIVKPLMIFFPSGNKELGIKQLKRTATHGKYAKQEARYFLMTLYYYFEKDMQFAEVYSLMLNKSFPDNPVFEKWLGRIAVKKGDWFTADSVFKNMLHKADKKLRGYNTSKVIREAAYYIGYNYKNLNEFDSALVYLQKCVKYSKKIDTDEESGFLINSTLYIGTINEMHGDYSKAKKNYEDVLDMREFGKSHELAEVYLERIEGILKKNQN